MTLATWKKEFYPKIIKQEINMQFRQGDVFIQAVKEIPTNAVKQKANGGKVILAEGEATGHAHAVAERNAVLYLVGAAMYLRCLRETEIEHEEHGPIILLAGDYLVRRQREYSPEAIRNVQD